MTWNVNGLWPKMFDPNFLTFVKNFDFVCLVETFLLSSNINIFQQFGFSVFNAPAVKLTKQGRPSGGVLCLIKNEYANYVKRINVEGNFIMFLIEKELFKLPKDILLTCAYLPPEGSTYYTSFDLEGNGVNLLENHLCDTLLERDVYVFICGDLNGRTGSVSQKMDQNSDIFNTLHLSDSVIGERSSQDSVLNNFGKSLLSLCTALDLCILNGRCEGDQQGCYTYICEHGSSVIDYFIMSSELYAILYNDISLRVVERIDTNHLPIVLSIKLCHQDAEERQANYKKGSNSIEIFKWNDMHETVFKENVRSEEAKLKVNEAINCIDEDANLALEKFNACLKDISACMRKRIRINGKSRQQDWFDAECKSLRKEVRKLLKKFRKTLKYADRVDYCLHRKLYKEMLNSKKKSFNRTMIDKLLTSIDSQKEFWETVQNIIPKKNRTSNQISPELWFAHFKQLLEQDDFLFHPQYDDSDDTNLSFNRPISIEEVELAVRRLKLKKAAGPDGIISEILKYASTLVVPFFHRYLNKLFDSGTYPDSWCESVILPLYKKGDVNNPGNYRGISLSNVSSKIYGFIINKRLQTWVEEIGLTGEYQAGFKAGYSTVDHMFTLLACIQKQFSLNRKLYAAFIDFQKCFDTINRNLLWPILLKNGIRGKMFRCIKSMYFCVRARIKCSDGALTQSINCTMGVKQGDICSPVLFSIFINELTREVILKGKHGVSLSQELFELFILLLADDVVLLSETIVGLQNQLNCLQRTANSLSLVVNLEKSNIVVFRKGGYLGRNERWFYQGVVMPVVNIYKYLGIYFTTRLSFTASCCDLASKGKRALLSMMHKLRMFNNKSVKVFIKLFDSRIVPIMTYGSELWGLYDAANFCEKTHLFGLKKFLSVNIRTPNDLLYKELNRYPITITCKINCIRYWLKIISMQDYRLPKKAYLMLCRIDDKGKQTWVSNVRCFLFQLGFGEVWYNQGVGNTKIFLRELKLRLIDCRWQDWSSHVHGSERFNMYISICNFAQCIPLYLEMDLDKYLTFNMTKIRFGISDLKVHYYRYRNHCAVSMLCPLCRIEDDTECHFILRCPSLNVLRKSLIPSEYCKMPYDIHLIQLLSSKNPIVIRKLCIFVCKGFRLRKQTN